MPRLYSHDGSWGASPSSSEDPSLPRRSLAPHPRQSSVEVGASSARFPSVRFEIGIATWSLEVTSMNRRDQVVSKTNLFSINLSPLTTKRETRRMKTQPSSRIPRVVSPQIPQTNSVNHQNVVIKHHPLATSRHHRHQVPPYLLCHHDITRTNPSQPPKDTASLGQGLSRTLTPTAGSQARATNLTSKPPPDSCDGHPGIRICPPKLSCLGVLPGPEIPEPFAPAAPAPIRPHAPEPMIEN